MGGTISVEGDVYNYGIILLEMFTGRRPTDLQFKDGLDLHMFVERAMPSQVMEFIYEDALCEGGSDVYKECVLSVLRIGIKCSMTIPIERMKMKDVLYELQKIKGIYEKEKSRQGRRNAR
ncbi:hypothetical protein Tsubulata_037775 [Turnera subulata]|uniref:Serine-threonine/tyrosine-protein kinase catalytic domain-containing protein n=1 Tax=Turnera subulata TaxID=218843 RepID=A0A9Q0FVD3_9ROSI|nr:hypothetical protein Tsubulata_037775 [Turnera subulata]